MCPTWQEQKNYDGYLNLFDRDKGVVLARYLNPFVQNTARHIIEDRSNPDLLWFGVEGYGLFSFNKKFTTQAIRAIEEDSHGILWLGSNEGLFAFDPKTAKVVRHYTTADGLQSDSFSLYG